MAGRSGDASNAKRTALTNVIVSNNLENGLSAFGRLSGRTVTANDNGHSGVAVYDTDTAIVKLRGFNATGNGFGGLVSGGLRTVLRQSTLTGNSYPPFPGMPTTLDLVTATLPRLTDTTSDYSWAPQGPWGVCTFD